MHASSSPHTQHHHLNEPPRWIVNRVYFAMEGPRPMDISPPPAASSIASQESPSAHIQQVSRGHEVSCAVEIMHPALALNQVVIISCTIAFVRLSSQDQK